MRGSITESNSGVSVIVSRDIFLAEWIPLFQILTLGGNKVEEPDNAHAKPEVFHFLAIPEKATLFRVSAFYKYKLESDTAGLESTTRPCISR